MITKVKLREQPDALLMTLCTPMTTVEEFLHGTGAVLKLINTNNGIMQMQIVDDEHEMDVRIDDWLVRIGDDVDVYDVDTMWDIFERV